MKIRKAGAGTVLHYSRVSTGQSLPMLILTRRIGETLMIGNDISVTVVGIKANQIRLGIQAPKDVPVHREEVYDRVHKDPPKRE